MDNHELLQALKQLLLEESDDTPNYIQQALVNERQHTEELFEKEIAPLRQILAELEDMPKQIELILEAQSCLLTKISGVEVKLDEIENKLDNATSIKAIN